MKPKNRLPKILYYLSNISYYISLVTVGFILILDVSGGFNIPLNYEMPASVMYQAPDANGIYSSEFRKYKNKKVITKEFEPTKVEEALRMQADISLNPKNAFHRTILIVRQYALYILSIFITWHLAQFFKKLNKDFTFNQSLKKHLDIIGFSLIGIEVLKLFISLINKAYITDIESVISVPSIPGSEHVLINFVVYPDINLIIVFVGLAILCLGSLLAYGQQIQEENELTI